MTGAAPGSPGCASPPPLAGRLARGALPLLPGVLLCVAVSLAALLLQAIEVELFGRAWLEALVLAILAGAAVRTAWVPGARLRPGIAFSAKTLLEVAVVLLGASLSAHTVLAAGPALLGGIAGVVALSLALSYGIGRALRLPRRMAVLVACGNSICGNSAIAAIAPVIGADARDVASSIAFTAVLGVLVVLGLPLLAPLLSLTGVQYGVVAGLTVYAVPQVLAATAPLGTVAVQVGTLVKLVRVLMLGPLVLLLSLAASRASARATAHTGPRRTGRRIAVQQLVPWFILGFLAMAGLRSTGLIPAVALPAMQGVATSLTVLSMAALGLGVDVRLVARAGGAVVATVSASLLALGAISLVLIWLLGIA